MTEEQRQHLEFIQNSINRANSNSFQIKGLAVTVLSALLGIYASNSKISIIISGIPSTLLFWYLDAYYLQQERKFRGIFNDVAGVTSNVNVLLYEFPLSKYKGKKYNIHNILFSKSVYPLYLTGLAFIIVISLISIFSDYVPTDIEKKYWFLLSMVI